MKETRDKFIERRANNLKDLTYLDEPLLKALTFLTRLEGTPFSPESLSSGLPISKDQHWPVMFSTKGSTKSNFSRAAARAGYLVKLVKKNLDEISPLLLPVILLLKENKTALLLEFSSDRTSAKVVLSDLYEEPIWLKVEDLEVEYLGFSFLMKKDYNYEEKAKAKVKNSKAHWFWDTLWQSRSIYYNVLLASVVINIFVLASPLFTMNVYDRVVPNNAVETLWVFALGVTVVYVLDILLKFIRTYFLEVASKKNDVIMSSKIFERVLNLKMENFPRSIGSFASNLKEFDHINSFFSSTTMAALVDLPFAFLFLFVIYIIGGTIIVVPLGVTFLILIYSLIVKAPLNRSIESVSSAAAHKNSILIEALNNVETIKTLGISGNSQWNWEESTGEISAKSIKSKLLANSISTITSFLVQLNTVIVVVYGVYMIQDGDLSMGGLIAIVILSGRAISPMGKVAGLLSNYEYTKTAFGTIDNIMNMPVERIESKKYIRKPSFKGKIELKNVSFNYPDETKKALTNISIIINPGEKVAIIGRVGSGKTTLGKLLLNLYEPNEGSVEIDGIDINQLDPVDIRKNIGYVSQDTYLFSGTIKDNILFKAPYTSDEKLLEIVKISCADTYISEHPKGFDMPIYEKGVGLSGGQKQSISLARILLNDPAILVLDEPTSGMDNTTESKLKRNLSGYLDDKTMILITHKNAMLDIVDRIVVVDKSRIVMDGPRDEIIKKLSKG